jgi:chaperonin cofactor prefoldin
MPSPKPSPAITPQSESEALVVQHALAFYRDMKQHAKNAPFGEFLHYAEAAAIAQGRTFIQTSLQTLAQDEVNEVEKKNETRLCRTCRKKKRHLGGKTKKLETAVGTIQLKRRYDECRACSLQEFIVDAILGIEEGYTVGLRSLAVYAGTGNSFMTASEHLKKYCGWDISHMTIRELCRKEAIKIDAWYKKSKEIQQEFLHAPGNVEITMDGTCVNTTEGAREVRIGLISKRQRGQGVLPEQWCQRNKRELPDIETCVAFAAVEEKELFQKRFAYWRSWLQLGATSDISALGDGAVWLWNIVREVFGKIRECLDVFHGLEHVSDTGKVLYGEGTAAYKKWNEETTLEFLEAGFELIEERLHLLEREERTDKEKESLRQLRVYLENNRERLGYRERLSEGRAIGSGQVEGACKNLIGKRLKQTWAKWKVERLDQMATLCALRYSHQWEKYWTQAK